MAMRFTPHVFARSRLTTHAGRAMRATVVVATTAATLFSVACRESVAPLSQLRPGDAERLLIGADTTDLLAGALEGTRADIRGLNNLGQTTGGSDPGGRQNEFTPYRWSPESGFTKITPLSASTAFGNDI